MKKYFTIILLLFSTTLCDQPLPSPTKTTATRLNGVAGVINGLRIFFFLENDIPKLKLIEDQLWVFLLAFGIDYWQAQTTADFLKSTEAFASTTLATAELAFILDLLRQEATN
jgi:hypothetical protein